MDIRAFVHAEPPSAELSVTTFKVLLLFLLLCSWHTHTHTRHSSHETESFNKLIFLQVFKKFPSLCNNWKVHCLVHKSCPLLPCTQPAYSNPSFPPCTLLVNYMFLF